MYLYIYICIYDKIYDVHYYIYEWCSLLCVGFCESRRVALKVNKRSKMLSRKTICSNASVMRVNRWALWAELTLCKNNSIDLRFNPQATNYFALFSLFLSSLLSFIYSLLLLLKKNFFFSFLNKFYVNFAVTLIENLFINLFCIEKILKIFLFIIKNNLVQDW